MKNKLQLIIISICFFSFLLSSHITEAATNWYWYYSNDNITQYCDTNSIKIIRDYNGNIDRIEAWIKTTYSDAGAQSTIRNYGLSSTPNINTLSYSMERVYINPKTREIASKQEVFYSSEGNSLWSEENNNYSLRWNTIRPSSPNEREFSVIVDQVFNSGNLVEFEKWKNDTDRWIGLSSQEISKGITKNIWFDNLSILLSNNRIYFWLYDERIENGIVIEKNYGRWAYSANTNTLELVTLSSWERGTGWIKDNESLNGKIISIIPDSAGEYWCSEVKKYVDKNRDYINRHSKKI